MKKQNFTVSGMSCAACVNHVEKSVRALDGVKTVTVSLLTASMTVLYDEAAVTETAITEAVRRGGYRAQAVTEIARFGRDSLDREEQGLRRRLIGSAVLTLILMYLSMYHMIPYHVPGFFHQVEAAVPLGTVQLLLTLGVVWLNRRYFAAGIPMLWRRSPTMDTLVAVGSGASVAYGVFALIRMAVGMAGGQMDLVGGYARRLYFEGAAMILTLVTLGKYWEGRSRRRTGEALEKLIALRPDTARILRDGQEISVAAAEVAAGDTVVVRAGETLPCDGVIVSGGGVLNEAALTGESSPADRGAGETVRAGTVNTAGYFHMRAEQIGEDTALSQMIRLVEEAASSRAPVSRLADRVAAVFVPVVMGLAALTVIVWLMVGESVEFAVNCGISVLVISCPCALGLATPLAVMVGVGQGAERGILIRSAEVLESAHRTAVVVLDKTGTVTTGHPRVTDVISFDPADPDGDNLLALAAAAEQASGHPLAAAIADEAAGRHLTLPAASDGFELIPGCGITAAAAGHTVGCGNLSLVRRMQADVTETLTDTMTRLSEAGRTALAVLCDGAVIGVIAAADTVRPDSAAAVRELTRRGIDVVMLTGDREENARAVAAEAGIGRVVAGILPGDKADAVKKLKGGGQTVMMIGDGINDAPALTAASVGVAVGAGTDVACQSADIVLAKNALWDAVNAIRLSRAVMTNIRENLFWAFFYNAVGIPVAAGVLYPAFGITLSPMIAAAAMSASSLCVVGNALRLRRFRMTDPPETDTTAPAESADERDAKPIEKENTDMKYEMTLTVKGMMCVHCKAHVEQALNALPGVFAEVDLDAGTARVRSDAPLDRDQLIRAVTDAGYEAE